MVTKIQNLCTEVTSQLFPYLARCCSDGVGYNGNSKPSRFVLEFHGLGGGSSSLSVPLAGGLGLPSIPGLIRPSLFSSVTFTLPDSVTDQKLFPLPPLTVCRCIDIGPFSDVAILRRSRLRYVRKHAQMQSLKCNSLVLPVLIKRLNIGCPHPYPRIPTNMTPISSHLPCHIPDGVWLRP